MLANDLDAVKRLIRDPTRRVFFQVVLTELRKHRLDDDDLVSVVLDDLGESHWFKSKLTQKYYPGTTSDYYSLWIDECSCRMFIKLLIALFDGEERVVITSFKKDDRYA